MKSFAALTLILLMASYSIAATPKGPIVAVTDGKISVHAEAVHLSWLLTLLERATGIHVVMSEAVANRSVSVQFLGLTLEDAIAKVFEGLGIDYITVRREQLVVTGMSASLRPEEHGPAQTVAVPTPIPVGSTVQQPAGTQPVPVQAVTSHEAPRQVGTLPLDMPDEPLPQGQVPQPGPSPNSTSFGPDSPFWNFRGGLDRVTGQIIREGSQPQLFGNTTPAPFNPNQRPNFGLPTIPGLPPKP